MFGLFKKKKKDIGFPSNELEQSILDSTTDQKAWEAFYTKLLWAELLVLTDGAEPRQDEGDNVTVKFFALESGHIPIFSSINRIHDKGIIKEEVPFIAIKAQDLFEITKGTSLVLNPYSDYPKELIPDEIDALLDGTIYDKLKEMEEGLSPQEIAELDALFNKAMTRQEKLIYLDGFRHKSLDIKTEKKLRQSIQEFEQILDKCPDHWQSMFGIAKALQRIGEHEKSLLLLENAMEVEKNNHFLALEASIEAVNLRDIEKALIHSEEAIKRAPQDFALLGNYALNLLVAGRDNEALDAIEKAMHINSKDQINNNINAIIDAVVNGKRKRPTFDELFRQ